MTVAWRVDGAASSPGPGGGSGAIAMADDVMTRDETGIDDEALVRFLFERQLLSTDRLLVAQATVEGITLLTSDAMVARYPGPVRGV